LLDHMRTTRDGLLYGGAFLWDSQVDKCEISVFLDMRIPEFVRV